MVETDSHWDINENSLVLKNIVKNKIKKKRKENRDWF